MYLNIIITNKLHIYWYIIPILLVYPLTTTVISTFANLIQRSSGIEIFSYRSIQQAHLILQLNIEINKKCEEI